MRPETPTQQPAVTLVSRDETVIKIHIDACHRALKDEDGRCKTRELALAATKLQEATFWIDEHLRIS